MRTWRGRRVVWCALTAVLVVVLVPMGGQAAGATTTTSCDPTSGVCYRFGANPPREPGVPQDQRAARATRFGQPGPALLPAGYPFWELQMNLCNSGLASCYRNGAAVGEAAGRIAYVVPDLVTLNEVCGPDVERLAATMADSWPGDWTYWAFVPAGHLQADGSRVPYLCRNGVDQYGIGVLGHVPAAQWAGVDAVGGWYAAQDTTHSTELRAYLCTSATGNFFGCTTHLATDGPVAMSQCQALMTSVIPQVWSQYGGRRPTVMGGDLNLRYKGTPNAQNCVPVGWFRKGDDSVQQVMATSDWTFDFTQKLSMVYTDHPAWLVALRAT